MFLTCHCSLNAFVSKKAAHLNIGANIGAYKGWKRVNIGAFIQDLCSGVALEINIIFVPCL